MLIGQTGVLVQLMPERLPNVTARLCSALLASVSVGSKEAESMEEHTRGQRPALPDILLTRASLPVTDIQEKVA